MPARFPYFVRSTSMLPIAYEQLGISIIISWTTTTTTTNSQILILVK